MKTRIADDVKVALKAGDKLRVNALRLILAAIKQKEIDSREELSEADILKLLNKMAKQRRESIAQYEAANRQDLRDQEQFELDLITSYLPAALTDNEIDALIDQAVQETDAAAVKDMGKVMGILQARIGGKADMGQVSQKVKQRLIH